jgi:hypothetical protein
MPKYKLSKYLKNDNNCSSNYYKELILNFKVNK